MPFDEQLKRSFDTLTDRLRDEIDRQVRAAMDELTASARADADAAATAAAAAAEVAAAEAAATIASVPAPVETPPSVDGAATERLVEAIRAIDRTRSLTEILDALIAAAAHEGTGAGVWLVRGGQLHHWRSVGVDAPQTGVPLDDQGALAEAARTNAPASDDGFAVPLALAGQVVAVLRVTSYKSQVASHESQVASHVVEILGRHAASRLEALTAFKTARAMTDLAEASSASPSPAPAPDDAEEHVSAQRYARLLVSEIKLYHEEAVIEGRRDRDLATRLGGEIARARVMYEQRVPPNIRQQADHFHDELVRTLADGDASLLELRT
jgi:hypothetical protein